MYVNITLTGLRCGPFSEVFYNSEQFDDLRTLEHGAPGSGTIFGAGLSGL